MLLSAKCTDVSLIEDVVRRLAVTSGSYVIAHVRENYVARFTYCSFAEGLSEYLEPELSFSRFEKTEINITLTSSKTACRACTDCVLCVSVFGDVAIEPLYSYLVEKSVEALDIRPEILLLEVVSTIYESDASYSFEKTAELLLDLARSRRLSMTNLTVALMQIRDCCANAYVMAFAYSSDMRLYYRMYEKNIAVLVIPEDLLTYANVQELVSKFSILNIPRGKGLAIRITPEVLWYVMHDLTG